MLDRSERKSWSSNEMTKERTSSTSTPVRLHPALQPELLLEKLLSFFRARGGARSSLRPSSASSSTPRTSSPPSSVGTARCRSRCRACGRSARLQTAARRKNDPPLDFGFSQTLQANKMLPALRNALRSADELDADVYFILKGRAAPTGGGRVLGER